jgi:hypothetical protein
MSCIQGLSMTEIYRLEIYKLINIANQNRKMKHFSEAKIVVEEQLLTEVAFILDVSGRHSNL